MAYVDIAWVNQDPQMALEHAHPGCKERQSILAGLCPGVSRLAYTIAGNLSTAVEDLAGALRFARSRKAGLENEARILADLADAYRLNGDTASALETVDEAIEVAMVHHARVPECLARTVRAAILLESKTADQKAAREELVRATELMRETGALIYRPIIDALASGKDLGSQTAPAVSKR